MKSHLKTKVNIVITFIIIVGFITMGLINYYTYSKIIKDDIENISKLTSTNIYSKIDNELIKPIFVSLTMANDSFVIDWLKGEGENDRYKLIKYLKRIKDKYNYNSVFLVSDSSRIYYHFDGIHKKVSTNDSHDVWYYNFLNQEKVYDLDVDQDEADNQQLTVFVNCKIYDRQENFLGVTGVGIKMNSLQELLKYYEDNFNLEAFLIDNTGIVQVHTDDKLIENSNLFNDENFARYKDTIINNKVDMLNFGIDENGIDGYLISRYINELSWYLIVKKDTSILLKSILKQLANDFIILALVIIVVLFITTKIINRFKKQLTDMAQTDQLTGISNRRAFEEYLEDVINSSKQGNSAFNVAIFDIDNFKQINDKYGHLCGDRIIQKTVQLVDCMLEAPDSVSRWGGDEFACIMFGKSENAVDKIKGIQSVIKNNSYLAKYNITISVGITAYSNNDTSISIVKRADKGMYLSKSNGRNQINLI